MPFAKAVLNYIENKIQVAKTYRSAYFLNSENVIARYTELGMFTTQENYIEVIVNNLNFELGVRDSNLYIVINDKKYKIECVKPVSGYGLKATTFLGVQI